MQLSDELPANEAAQATADPATADPATAAPAAATPAAAAPAAAPATDPAAATAATAAAAAEKAAAYETLNVTLAEDTPLDEEGLKGYRALAQEYQLEPKAAQAVLDFYAERVEALAQEQAEQVAAWAEATRKDGEIGGDKLTASLALAHKARDAFGSPELMQALDATGLSNHPAVVKFFVKAGAAISEDTLIASRASGSSGPVDMAKTLFPNQA